MKIVSAVIVAASALSCAAASAASPSLLAGLGSSKGGGMASLGSGLNLQALSLPTALPGLDSSSLAGLSSGSASARSGSTTSACSPVLCNLQQYPTYLTNFYLPQVQSWAADDYGYLGAGLTLGVGDLQVGNVPKFIADLGNATTQVAGKGPPPKPVLPGQSVPAP